MWKWRPVAQCSIKQVFLVQQVPARQKKLFHTKRSVMKWFLFLPDYQGNCFWICFPKLKGRLTKFWNNRDTDTRKRLHLKDFHSSSEEKKNGNSSTQWRTQRVSVKTTVRRLISFPSNFISRKTFFSLAKKNDFLILRILLLFLWRCNLTYNHQWKTYLNFFGRNATPFILSRCITKNFGFSHSNKDANCKSISKCWCHKATRR